MRTRAAVPGGNRSRHVDVARRCGKPRHAEGLVMRGHDHVDDGATFLAFLRRHEVQPARDFRRRAGGLHTAL